jgi:hypothetical protein
VAREALASLPAFKEIIDATPNPRRTPFPQ